MHLFVRRSGCSAEGLGLPSLLPPEHPPRSHSPGKEQHCQGSWGALCPLIPVPTALCAPCSLCPLLSGTHGSLLLLWSRAWQPGPCVATGHPILLLLLIPGCRVKLCLCPVLLRETGTGLCPVLSPAGMGTGTCHALSPAGMGTGRCHALSPAGTGTCCTSCVGQIHQNI